MFETTFEGKLAQLTGPLLTWAAQDLSVAPVADLPTDIEVLLRARNLVDGELLVCDRSGESARLGGGSTVGWLADAGRLDHRHASSLVRTARGLADRLPATAKGAVDG